MQPTPSSDLEITVPTWRANGSTGLEAPRGRALPALRSHLWIARYCECARRLRPDMRMSAVVRRAVAAYPHASDMPPESAAQLDASLLLVRDHRNRFAA